MIQYPTNGWFHQCEFMRAAKAVFEAAPTVWLGSNGAVDCKYIQLYVDQRTKSFIFRNASGQMLTAEEVYRMFPQLRDDVKIVSAGVRPFPE